jgi:hypothetical protein
MSSRITYVTFGSVCKDEQQEGNKESESLHDSFIMVLSAH